MAVKAPTTRRSQRITGNKSSQSHFTARVSVSRGMFHVLLSICSSSRGPEGVKIENADGAVATVTGLEVGTYEFTLTVTDDRKLQSSDTVTVIVREGELRMKMMMMMMMTFVAHFPALQSRLI